MFEAATLLSITTLDPRPDAASGSNALSPTSPDCFDACSSRLHHPISLTVHLPDKKGGSRSDLMESVDIRVRS